MQITFDTAEHSVKPYGFLLIKAVHPKETFATETIVESFARVVRKKYNKTYSYRNFAYEYDVSMLDAPFNKVIMVDFIPKSNFWKSCHELMQMFRLVFDVECVGCNGIWRYYLGKRCSGCRYEQILNPDLATSFNHLMEEAFGTNKI